MALGDTGRRIKALREGYRGVGMKQSALAKAVSVTQQRLSNWENGKHDPPSDVLVLIAKALDTSVQFLLSGAPDRPKEEVSSPLYPIGFRSVPLPYGGLVPAGTWSDPFETEDFIEVDDRFDGPGRFACRIEGDCMYPFLEPDDVGVFQSYGTRRPRIGDILIARREDNSVTLKILAYENGEFQLKPLNPAFTDAMAATWEHVGFLVGFIRRRGTYVRTEFNPDGMRIADTMRGNVF